MSNLNGIKYIINIMYNNQADSKLEYHVYYVDFTRETQILPTRSHSIKDILK